MAQSLAAGDLGEIISPAADKVFSIAWMAVELILFILAIYYLYVLFSFNQRVIIRQYAKGGRVITKVTKAKVVRNHKMNCPQLQFFGSLGFGGLRVNVPPSECVVPCKNLFTKVMYDFVEKDGLFYPVQNLVLGKKYTNSEGNEVHSIEGSGLEIPRDYDSEQAIQNNMVNFATKYRNKKPIEIAAMYGLMIVVIVGSVIVMVYSWKQFGNMAGAIYSLGEPLKEGVTGAINQRLGPG